MSDTPIFTQLLIEYRRAGRSLPWGHSFKPEGTIGILEETSQGIVPIFNIRMDPEETKNSIEDQIRIAKVLNQRIQRGYRW